MDQDKLRFMSKINFFEKGKCWNWTGALHKGYGSFWSQGENIRAHRYSYMIAFDTDVGEDFVCHSCDNPSCVNPDHLWIGNASMNAKDMASKGRVINQYMFRTECKHGHKYTEENTYMYKGNRNCRECTRIRGRKYSKTLKDWNEGKK